MRPAGDCYDGPSACLAVRLYPAAFWVPSCRWRPGRRSERRRLGCCCGRSVVDRHRIVDRVVVVIEVDPASVRLARASWDAATPGTRVIFLLRSKAAALQQPDSTELQQFPFRDWDELPHETAVALAWDVQFVTYMLRGGRDALRASEGVSAASLKVVA